MRITSFSKAMCLTTLDHQSESKSLNILNKLDRRSFNWKRKRQSNNKKRFLDQTKILKYLQLILSNLYWIRKHLPDKTSEMETNDCNFPYVLLTVLKNESENKTERNNNLAMRLWKPLIMKVRKELGNGVSPTA